MASNNSKSNTASREAEEEEQRLIGTGLHVMMVTLEEDRVSLSSSPPPGDRWRW